MDLLFFLMCEWIETFSIGDNSLWTVYYVKDSGQIFYESMWPLCKLLSAMPASLPLPRQHQQCVTPAKSVEVNEQPATTTTESNAKSKVKANITEKHVKYIVILAG